MKIPYSYSDALEMCSKFQYLKGLSFGNGPHIIDAIVVTPYDTNFKQRFFLYYLLFDSNCEEALQDYKGLLFDVCVVARDMQEELAHESLSTWLSWNEESKNTFLPLNSNYNHSHI